MTTLKDAHFKKNSGGSNINLFKVVIFQQWVSK